MRVINFVGLGVISYFCGRPALVHYVCHSSCREAAFAVGQHKIVACKSNYRNHHKERPDFNLHGLSTIAHFCIINLLIIIHNYCAVCVIWDSKNLS